MEQLSKKEKLNIFLIILLTIVAEVVFYFIADLFEYRAHLLFPGFIDNLIPIKTYFIYPYIFWYIMLFLVPYMLGLKDDNQFKKYIKSVYVCLAMALLIFIIYPTIMERPEIIINNFNDRLLSIVHIFSTPTKCIPSMHVALSTLFIVSTTTSKMVKKQYKIFVITVSVIIILSTMFVKQHYFIDVITGIIVGVISWFLLKTKLLKRVKI